MTERALFNRRYTSYTPNGTEVWLLNGAGVQTTLSNTTDFIAGVDLNQGQVVFVSGTYVVPAVAASGATQPEYRAIGVTAEAAFQNATLSVVLDDAATIPGSQITAESALTPGQTYYLSKYSGELTKYSTASGLITRASGYAALAPIGTAVSTSELQVEIGVPVILTD
jgi:hypothetical protein